LLIPGDVALGSSGCVQKPVFLAASDITNPAKCGYLAKKTSK